MTAELRKLAHLAQRSDVYRDAQRMAVIDMGSNSFRLIVVEYVPNISFRVVDEIREAVRLSEGMGDSDVLRVAAMERALSVARIYAAFCKASGISDVVAAGTSAIRDAANQARFLARMQAETGITVRVLSGEEEAYYGYLAALNSTTLEDGFVLDQGGGSMQISRVEGRQIRESVSFPFGAVRLTEQFLRSDPVSNKELDALRGHLEKAFSALKWFRFQNGMQLVAEGGNIRLTGQLVKKKLNYPLDVMHGFTIQLPQLKILRSELSALTIAERRAVAGMKPDRADIALAGVVAMHEALRASGTPELIVSGQGMREGVFYERFLAGAGQPIFANVRQSSVLNLAHLYHFQAQHAEHIAKLTLSMFDQLPAELHACGAAEREVLWAAAMLHDIGVAIDYHDHHKHGAYLVLNDGLPGYSHREIALIALLVRYHRKGEPRIDELAPLLAAGDETRLLQLCALLRLAEQIDRSRDGVAQRAELSFGRGWAQLELHVRGDGQVALWSVERHVDIFEQAFGLQLEVSLVPSE